MARKQEEFELALQSEARDLIREIRLAERERAESLSEPLGHVDVVYFDPSYDGEE